MEREVLQRSAAAPQAEAETSSSAKVMQTPPQAAEASQTEAAAPQAEAETSSAVEALQTPPQAEAPVPDFLAENPLGKREADISGEARGVPVK